MPRACTHTGGFGVTNQEAIIDPATGKACDQGVAENRVRGIFGAIADKYELFNLITSFGIYRRWLKHTIQAAPLTSQSRMLDLAGGTGDVSWTACQLKPPAHIQLTDLTPAMLEVAKSHIAEGKNMGVPISLEVVDAQEIPYPDQSFDVVTMAYGIRNMPDRPRALSEMLRVLKPGGHLVCLEFSTPPNAVWRALYNFYLKHLIPFWGGLITGDKAGFVYLSKSIKAFPNQEGLAKMMREAGFVDVTWKNYTGGIAAVHVAKKPE